MSGTVQKHGRIIFHVDMNSFYASVEMAHHPELRGKPLAIAGDPKERHGIVITSSYEARAKGVKTTMTVWEARRKCPELIVIPPDFQKYRKASAAMFAVLREYTEWVQPMSIDEGYLDLTDFQGDLTPPKIAEQIQKRLLHHLKLPCSIGIAPNKFLAKMASGMKKPLGITVLRKRDIPAKLWSLDVGEMHGIGKKTKAKLTDNSIMTIGDLAKADDMLLKKVMGINGGKMKQHAGGIDSRPVDPNTASEFKSVGHSTTLSEDTKDIKVIENVLGRLAKSVEKSLHRKESVAMNIQLILRYQDWQNTTRSRRLRNPVLEAEDIYQAAYFLLKKNWNEKPVRLLGITAHELLDRDAAYRQLDLFTYEKEVKKASLHQAMRCIREKYEKKALRTTFKGLSSKE